MNYQLGRLQIETGLRWRLIARYIRYYRHGNPGYALRLGPFGFTWEGGKWV